MTMEEPSSDRLRRAVPGSTVLQIVPALDAGPDAEEVLDIALALVRAGARALVAGPEGHLVPELQSFGGEWIAVAGPKAHRWQMRQSRRALQELIETERVDIVHARGIGGARLASTLAQGAIHLVIGCGEEAIARRRDRRYARALSHCNSLIVHSAYLAEQIVQFRQVARERIVEIPRAIETARFDPAAVSVDRVVALRQAWKLESGVRVALMPGRLDPANGQHVLVEAIRMLVSGGLRRMVFVLAGDRRGDPGYADAVQSSAHAHGVGRVVRQVGICADMPAAYAAADFVVLPIIAPPTFRRTAAEALAMGRPMVASAIGCLPEFVLAPPRTLEVSRTGWLVPPEDPLGLAQALATAEALPLPALRAMGMRARRQAVELFTPARVAAATLSVYASLLEAGA